MAKVKINWPPMSMKAEGEDAAVLAQAEQFLKYVKEAHKISFDVLPTIFRDGCRDPEEGVGEPECVGCNDDCESCETYENANSVKPLTEPEEVAPGAQWDVVAIYDNAGIPSIMHHSNRFGGLATHTVNVADAAMELCETNHAFKDCDKNAVLVAALLHDICKVNKYHETAFHKYGYEDRGLLGHGEESVIMAQRFIKLTGKEIIAVRWHMGAYCGRESWDTLGTAYDRYPEVLCLHFADMIATHYDER